MPGALYALPADNVTASATPSLVSGSANASYPLTNIDDLDPGLPFKAVGTACTIRWTFGAPQRLQAIGIFNHNLHGLNLTLTNNAGMPAQTIAVPAVAGDGLPVNPWKDLRLTTDWIATRWDLAITGAAAAVAIGEVGLFSTLRELNIKWGWQDEGHPVIEHRTEYGRRLIYDLDVRSRLFAGTVPLFTDRDALRVLHRAAHGSTFPFLLIPNEDDNDAMLVQWRESSRSERFDFITPDNADGVGEFPVAFEEMNAGVAL